MLHYLQDPPLPTTRPIRVMLVDDHLILMQGLDELLGHEEDLEIVGMIVGGTSALAAVERVQPDVILMDIQMPEMDGLEATRRILQQHPQARILIFSSSSNAQDVQSAFAAGVRGYLLKSTGIAQVLHAIRQVMAGEPAIDPAVQRVMMQQFQQFPPLSLRPPLADGLTERETAVMRLIARGHSNKEIGTQLGLAENTVKHHVSNILQKWELTDRTQLAIYAHQQALL